MEKNLTMRVAEIMAGIWTSDEKREEALRKALTENEKDTALVDAVAQGVKKALEPEPELSYEQEQRKMLDAMYPSLSEVKPVKEVNPDATLHEALYPSMFAKDGE